MIKSMSCSSIKLITCLCTSFSKILEKADSVEMGRKFVGSVLLFAVETCALTERREDC